MKTNIIKIALKWLVIPTLLITTVLSANADWNSYGNPSPTPRPNCAAFHNAGYTGAVGGSGTNFPSFNGYKDQRTEDGRAFDERQFTYIETQHADGNGLFPNESTSDYTPWVTWSNYSFNTPQATDYTFNFSNNPNQKYYIGFWGYMHNNGAPDAWPAHGVNVELDGVNGPANNEFFPKYTINANNTCPLSVEADVRVAGNRDFTMNFKEVYMFKEYPNNQPNNGWTYEVKDLSGNSGWISGLLGEGGPINSNSGYTTARFDSSDDHYALIYTEFEIIPEQEEEEPKECRSLEIVSPNGANDGNSGSLIWNLPTINTDVALENLPLAIQVDTDDDVIENYHYLVNPPSRGITLSETPNGPGTGELFTNQKTVYMNGVPNDQPNDPQQISVAAVDDEGIWISPCGDAVKFVYQPDDVEEPECEDLDTNPGSLGGQPVALNANTTITLDGPIDTEGNPFTVNGDPAVVQYCYSNTNITFSPDIWQTSQQCAQAPSNVELTVIPSSPGTMTIDVLGTDVAACADSFETEENQYGGVCLDLDFVPHDIDFNNGIDEYCVELDLEPTVEGYNNEIAWSVTRNGSVIFNAETDGDPCIDLEDYNYDWLPGDSLEAKALIEYEDEDCEDIIGSDEEECTEFELEQSKFERGRDNEICVDDTDWPIQSTGVYVSVDGDDEFLVEVDEDDCFILDENDLRNADDIEVWVPEWKDECNDDLDRIVYPPEFDKNVKDEDRSSASFSSRAAINFSDHLVDYQITYEQKNDEDQDVTITDTIGRIGYIQGYIASATSDISGAPEGGRIYFDEGSMQVWVEGEGDIDDCDDTNDRICYNGSIGDRDGVEIENVPPRKKVVVTYSGEVDTVVSPSNCSDQNHPLITEGAVCGEIYPNVAEFDDEAGFDGDDNADVIIPCPFIIVRSGGEVFLENPFDYGVDTLSCSEIENVPVPIITPDNPPTKTPSTGEGESILSAFSDRLCKNEAVEGYGDIKNISSLICEITLKTSDDLTQFAIVQNIARNIQLFARYDKNLDNTSTVDGSNGLPSSTSNVYVKSNGNLTLGGTFEDGAQTIVVLGGDVTINKNIRFNDPANLTDPRQIPSLALIVIGGDIIVAPGVTETNGIFFVQEGEDGEGGKMCEGTCAENDQYNENRLIHNGSIYGDIQHLFKYRTFAGDPTKEEAAILIRFDNRIYLNTPPILGQLVNVTSEVF